jgi:hypothetical protein
MASSRHTARRALQVLAPCVLASLLVATAARAQLTAADRETARTMMEQGRDLRDKGDLKEALKRFKAADDIMHVPTTGLEVARTQVSLGLLVEARDTIAAIRQRPAKPNDPSPFKDARTKADDLDGSLEGRVPSVTVTVQGAAAGDQPTVSIDGVALAAAVIGLPRSVDPGHHVIDAKTPNAAGKVEVDVKEGDHKPVQVTLAATGAPAPPDQPEQPPPAAPDEPPPPTRSHSPTVLTWIGVGIAVAGVATGAVTGALSMSKKSKVAGECGNDVCTSSSSDSDLSTAYTLATVSDIGFAAAGVGAVVAVVTLAIGHQTSSEPAAQPPAQTGQTRLRVLPWIGMGAAGVNGTF